MRRNAVVYAVRLVLVVLLSKVLVGPVAAQNAPTVPIQLPTDRTVLPIPEPQSPHSTVLDARNATPGWLTAKVVGLLAYIGFGMVALRRGRTKRIRTAFLLLAVASAAYVVWVALTRDPAGPLALTRAAG